MDYNKVPHDVMTHAMSCVILGVRLLSSASSPSHLFTPLLFSTGRTVVWQRRFVSNPFKAFTQNHRLVVNFAVVSTLILWLNFCGEPSIVWDLWVHWQMRWE
jgi:hypothetical protein